NLRKHRCSGRACKEGLRHEQAAYTAEIDAREEILEIDIENETLACVPPGVRENAAAPDEAVRAGVGVVGLLQDRRETLLQFSQKADRRIDAAHAAGTLRNFERAVAPVLRRLVKRPRERAVRYAEKACDIMRIRERIAIYEQNWPRLVQGGRSRVSRK